MKITKKSLLLGLFITLGWILFLGNSSASASSQIRITEIMYDPLGSGDKEFIEIYNGSDTTADLSGWSFSSGVNFSFPGGSSLAPGKYGVIVRNRTVFRSAYPSANILGQYVGKLVGRGELVKLVEKNGSSASQVDYRNGAGWPTAPRNGGPSLSLIKATGDETQPGCWGSSTAAGGSPGFTNSASGGGSCPTKAYPTSPAAQQPTSGTQKSTGGSSSGANKNSTSPGQGATPAEGQQDTGDQTLQNLTEAQKEELKKQDSKEVQEDLQDELGAISGGQKSADPALKKIAGLVLGTLVISMGVGYFGLEKLAHSNTKAAKKFKKFAKKSRFVSKMFGIKR